MWQLSALAWLLTKSGMRVADKAALVYVHRVDSYVATFYRQFIYLFFMVAIGYLGWAGTMSLAFSWQVVVYGLITTVSSFAYTYLLRKVEATGLEALACLSPLLFLFIDTSILHIGLTPAQMVAIVILSLGGFAFSLDGRKHRLKREFTPFVWLLLGYILFDTAVEYYIFSHLNAHYGVNGLSFFVSVYIIVTLLAFLVVVLKRKTHLVLHPVSLRYLPYMAIGKLFDASSSLFWAYALTLAAVSQVAAIGALEPLFVLLVAVISQKERIRIRERIDKGNLHWKISGVVLLVVGALLIR